ncbi:flavin reductase family protein [Pseudomonas sp. HR96]|uniref:flavin reductase family protein n=1 Tax=Pseudomonas sp. HR96 TaxID=1027966 RepID=UPI002A760EC6|nr:flavin reductase family protein [Pseudomonas sp. HR96]WPO97731.1 flavin reductase family protein [Pseudomonas sp. HR96]
MIEPSIYKDVMASFPSGVTVVTTLDADGGIAGITASAFSALSIHPALVLFCPNYESDTYPLLQARKRFAIHLLGAEQQAEAYAFASKGKDKAKAIEWHLSALGNPLLGPEGKPHATAIIECELWREYEGGDHAIMVGEVKNLILPEQAVSPMLYYRAKLGALPALS